MVTVLLNKAGGRNEKQKEFNVKLQGKSDKQYQKLIHCLKITTTT